MGRSQKSNSNEYPWGSNLAEKLQCRLHTSLYEGDRL